MRSPEDMKIIEIDITNACIHNCSNCTRMCGHHTKPYFMSWETFKRAVDSMEGYEGGVSMMGGEPTLHPQFERFAEYLNEKYKDTPKQDNYFITPTRNFIRDRKLEERNRTYSYEEKTGTNVIGQRVKGAVLFSSLASNYYKYYETIQDVFHYQGINDHIVPCYHQPIGVTRKDMGISDEEWSMLRDACWVQNAWSASITPKGCFFCEVAGVLDMLFDGPGGWPIEEGWWKRKPEDFKDQLSWCELCGAALDTRSRNANDEIDDMSISFYKKLEEIGSPKLKRGQVNVYTKEENTQEEGKNRKFDYHNTNSDRVSRANRAIYPKFFSGLLICDDESLDEIEECIEKNVSQFERLTVFVEGSTGDSLEEKYKESENIDIKKKEKRLGINLARFNMNLDSLQYVVFFTSGVRFAPDFTYRMKQYAINPGTMHSTTMTEFMNKDKDWFEMYRSDDRICLYNTDAKALRIAGFDGTANIDSIDDFICLWNDKKRVHLGADILKDREPINELEIKAGLRYAVFGTGTYGRKAYEKISDVGSKIAFFCDSNEKKRGDKSFENIDVLSPEELKSKRDLYDKVVIASISYKDMRSVILDSGLTDRDIVAPIF